MTPERPDWARRERAADLKWIRENLHVFVPAAKASFKEQGRGAIVIDTTQQPVEGVGNPFAYYPQAVIERKDDEDVKRIVRDYDPQEELVLVLLKAEERMSIYCVQAFQQVWTRRRRRR